VPPAQCARYLPCALQNAATSIFSFFSFFFDTSFRPHARPFLHITLVPIIVYVFLMWGAGMDAAKVAGVGSKTAAEVSLLPPTGEGGAATHTWKWGFRTGCAITAWVQVLFAAFGWELPGFRVRDDG